MGHAPFFNLKRKILGDPPPTLFYVISLCSLTIESYFITKCLETNVQPMNTIEDFRENNKAFTVNLTLPYVMKL